MVKKTKRFKHNAKKSIEYIAPEKPTPQIVPPDPILNKTRMIAIAAGIAAVIIAIALVLVFQTSVVLQEPESETLDVPHLADTAMINLSAPPIIFEIYGKPSERIENNTFSRITLEPRDDAEKIYSYLRNTDNSTIAVYPSFTRTSYALGGLAYNYLGDCENCIASRIIYDDDGAYAEGHTAYQALKILGYDFITDVDIDKNPEILSKYDRVILLHNEYATQNMFDAITSHPNVVYLYPGALSIKTNADYVAEQLLLVRGHGYPDESVKNGFDWEFDNSNLTDASCLEWEFVRIDNGYMLNCYPESIIHASPLLLLSIKELDDPYWAKPLQDQSFEVMDSNQLKLTLLNNEFLKLITPQENTTLALENNTMQENMTLTTENNTMQENMTSP